MDQPSPKERTVVQTEYGEAWVYESIVGALPGIHLTNPQAIALQVGLFEVGLLVIAWVYDLWEAVLPGTVAVAVAAIGSVLMLRMGRTTRRLDLPHAYQRMLFGSNIEVVLAVLAFVALVTHLFVFEPQRTATPLIESFFGPEPSILPVYLMLLVLWDLCYRLGTSWWAAVVSAWGTWRYSFDESTTEALRRVDVWNVVFALSQLVLLPFIADRPVLLTAVTGHVVGVSVVSMAIIAVSLRQ